MNSVYLYRGLNIITIIRKKYVWLYYFFAPLSSHTLVDFFPLPEAHVCWNRLKMDGISLFRRLGVGAKFDFKRFQSDAERLKVRKYWVISFFFLNLKVYSSFYEKEIDFSWVVIDIEWCEVIHVFFLDLLEQKLWHIFIS